MIHDAVRSVDPRVPVFDVKTMDERLDVTLAKSKSLYHRRLVPHGSCPIGYLSFPPRETVCTRPCSSSLT